MGKNKPRQNKTQANSSKTNDQEKENSPSFLNEFYDSLRKTVLFLCHHIIFGPINFKLTVYYSIIIIGSLLQLLDWTPQSYFSSKKNIFNVYFVKFGWAWILGLLIPFIYLNLRRKSISTDIILRHLSRLVVGTIFWLIFTNLFIIIERATGYCSHPEFSNVSRYECKRNGAEWIIGHDISGHIFLIVYTLLIINEEIQAYDRCHEKSQTESHLNATQSEHNEVNVSTQNDKQAFNIYLSMIHAILPFFLACLTIIWEIMLLSTSLYFHTMLHKLEGAILATGCWWITYRLWFQPNSKNILLPPTPIISDTTSS